MIAKVVIVYKSLPQYRKSFFELLKKMLARRGIDLLLIYGEPNKSDASKRDLVNIAWAHKIKNKIVHCLGKDLYWQPCLSLLKGADLIIVEQAGKLLLNYYLVVLNLMGIVRLAFWGHGKNFQASPKDCFAEKMKRFMASKVYWWFAYNDLSAQIVKKTGFPEKQITVVQNAIDSQLLIDKKEATSQLELEALRRKLNIRSKNVSIYVGGMYSEKRLPFLLEACQLIKREVPDFEMIFLGSGPDAAIVLAASQQYPWIHYEGPKFNEEKVPYFMISKLLLMPGLVGLVVLDAFSLEVPLITTKVFFHSPEIDYLENGVNGEIVEVPGDVGRYAERVVFLLCNENARQVLVRGCRRAKDKYSIENMVKRFTGGIAKALAGVKAGGK